MDEDQSVRQLSRVPTVTTVRQWIVAADAETARLDTFLAARLAPLSRRELAEWITTGQVLLNGRPSKKGVRLRAGDTVTAPAVCPAPPPNFTPLVDVVYRDAALVVLDKPAGIPSVALRHTETNTVANFLAAHFPETVHASPHPLECGLVHRLDTATSGLLVAARTSSAYASLREQFRAHTVVKQYLALVDGVLQTSGRISLSLAPSGSRGQRMQVNTKGHGQQALTTYAPVTVLSTHTLVRVVITTGVRHQIRAHLAALGHPIVGDQLYGATERKDRLYLHAQALACIHPITGRRVHFYSPVPRDFATFLEHFSTQTAD